MRKAGACPGFLKGGGKPAQRTTSGAKRAVAAQSSEFLHRKIKGEAILSIFNFFPKNSPRDLCPFFTNL